MNHDFYSIRMHSSLSGQHLSGAEQLAPFDEMEELAKELLRRAFEHERGCADSVQINIEPINADELVQGRLPEVETCGCSDVVTARHNARELLLAAGVSGQAVDIAIESLANGAAPGGTVMRGAMLVDAATGERLEADPARGVRVSRLGISPVLRLELTRKLGAVCEDVRRVSEALVLASKVQKSSDVLAELCWSDDPSYVTGYVACEGRYTRLSPLKESGDALGGRVFFVRSGCDRDSLVNYLEKTPYLVTDLGCFSDSGGAV
jgi:6-carboxyhexanoate--CoA ligase